MKALDVFYYYYFLFYSRVLKDNEPHLLTTPVLIFSESLLVNYSINVIGAHFFCKYLLGKLGMISVIVILNGLNYLFYHRTGRAKEIKKSKSKFFNNYSFSLVATLLFF